MQCRSRKSLPESRAAVLEPNPTDDDGRKPPMWPENCPVGRCNAAPTGPASPVLCNDGFFFLPDVFSRVLSLARGFFWASDSAVDRRAAPALAAVPLGVPPASAPAARFALIGGCHRCLGTARFSMSSDSRPKLVQNPTKSDARKGPARKLKNIFHQHSIPAAKHR